MLKAALLPMLCGCVLLTDAPISAQDLDTDCKDPRTQMEMTFCAGKDFEAADKDLNVRYQSTRRVMKERDAEASTDALKGAEDALVKAQRAWVAYRDAECVSRGYQARGGSMEPMLIAACKAELTRARTGELKTLSETM